MASAKPIYASRIILVALAVLVLCLHPLLCFAVLAAGAHKPTDAWLFGFGESLLYLLFFPSESLSNALRAIFHVSTRQIFGPFGSFIFAELLNAIVWAGIICVIWIAVRKGLTKRWS